MNTQPATPCRLPLTPCGAQAATVTADWPVNPPSGTRKTSHNENIHNQPAVANLPVHIATAGCLREAIPTRNRDAWPHGQPPLHLLENRVSCDLGRVSNKSSSNKSPSKNMFTTNSQFPHHKLFTFTFPDAHLMPLMNKNVGMFVPIPHHAGVPTYGPDRWLTVTGPGVDGSLQNFTIHHAALLESDLLNRTSLPAFFHLDALQDVDGFAKALLNPDDPFARLIRKRLPELSAWDGSSPIPRALASRIVTELNCLVESPELLSQVPFVSPSSGSFALGLAENPNPSRKDRALLVKSLIEDAYPACLSRHRRLRSVYGVSNAVCFVVGFTVSQYGFGTPFPLRIVCRPNTCSKELAAAMTRGEVTDIRIGGDIIGATLPVPAVVQPDKPGICINDERVFSLGFGADTGIKPPRTRSEFNALTEQLSAGDPVAVEPTVPFNPFDTPRKLGFEVERRPAMAA